MLSGCEKVWKNISRILESTGKVLESMASNTVGTVTSASSCHFVRDLSCYCSALVEHYGWFVSNLTHSRWRCYLLNCLIFPKKIDLSFFQHGEASTDFNKISCCCILFCIYLILYFCTYFIVYFSRHFNGHFPGEPVLAGVYWSKGWWRWWWQLEL